MSKKITFVSIVSAPGYVFAWAMNENVDEAQSRAIIEAGASRTVYTMKTFATDAPADEIQNDGMGRFSVSKKYVFQLVASRDFGLNDKSPAYPAALTERKVEQIETLSDKLGEIVDDLDESLDYEQNAIVEELRLATNNIDRALSVAKQYRAKATAKA